MKINIETKKKQAGFVVYKKVKYFFTITEDYIMFEPQEIISNNINNKILGKFDFHIRNVLKYKT